MKHEFFLGANYWSRVNNIQMWNRWDEKSIEDDLKKAREIGLNSLRIFLLATDFSDERGNLKREGEIKLRKFLEIAKKYEIVVFPSLIVGHMSGKNWPLPWDLNNRVYTPTAINGAARFISQVVSRFKKYENIGGWILSNEITHVNKPTNLEEFTSWLRELYLVIKSIDPNRPVSIGDSVSYNKPIYLKPENVREYVDYLSPHIYLYDIDPIRHTFSYASIIEYDRSIGKEVLLEEVGYPTSLYDEESHAGFIEVILSAALMLGAKGVFIWCFSDFQREEDEPYLWEPHELSFGIFRSDGSKKPVADVILKFSKLLTEIDSDLKLLERGAAVLVPEHFYKRFPFHNMPVEDEARSFMETFTQAKGASLPITFVREEEEYANLKRYKLIIVPSISRLKTVTWRKLLKWVKQGGTLYYSYSRYATWPHMSASHIWEDVFGVKTSLKAGMIGEPIESIEIKFSKNLYPLKAGDKITYINYKEDVLTSPFVPLDAEIIATCNKRPAIFLAKRGKGHVVFSRYPLELILARSKTLKRIREGYHRIYSALLQLSGIRPLFVCQDPRVETEYVKLSEDYLVALINHSYDEVLTTLRCPKEGEIKWIKWGKVLGKDGEEIRISLRPKSSMFIRFTV